MTAALTREEIGRKGLHFLTGILLPLGILYLPGIALRWDPRSTILPPWAWAPVLLAAGLVLLGGVDLLRMRVPLLQALFCRWFGSFMRPEESRKITGSTYIALSALLCSLAFKDQPHLSCMALATFLWGDAGAALVGLRVGRIRIGKKTLEGSLACFALCMFLYVVAFPAVPRLLDAWNGRMPLLPALAASLCVTLLELAPLRIGSWRVNDNLITPVITGLLLGALQPPG